MTLSIRNPEADALAKRLAEIDGTTITDAVIRALKETLKSRIQKESASETARRLLVKHGLKIHQPGYVVPQSAYHDLDHDLTGEDD
jgi:antitoxin VapB